MYLKSLTLKGFKSFADKTHMAFDSGLNVVVGPNGSGKSNVSDAILWVLGEQSAKMLRGAQMEDVIFSGSSARNPVGVAEVTLVLDNSDHTIPIDFSELGITRRMFRSGESEYLINNSPARLMDITDILHDSGLGKDTHSIISQGKLDSILASRPEDRRSLIEEAADISKHQRRRNRAERKLKQMDENLARAKVVHKEIMRQLKPLERQVDKARAAKELQDQLDDLEIMLYVDDLRILQAEYERLNKRQQEADAAIELAQYRYDEKVAELEKLQSMLEQKGLFVGDLGEQRRRMQDQLGRMDSDMRLLEEKGKNMVSRLSEMRLSLSTMEKSKQDSAKELEMLESELASITGELAELESQADDLQIRAREAQEERRRLDQEINRLTKAERAASHDVDAIQLQLAKLQEQIKHAEVEDSMYASRLEQIAEQRSILETEREQLESRGAKLSDDFEEAQKETERLTAALSELVEQTKAAREQESATRLSLSEKSATMAALEAQEKAARATNPLLKSMSVHPAMQGIRLSSLADVIRVDSEYEELLEQLLPDALASFIAPDDDTKARVAHLAQELFHDSGIVHVLSSTQVSTEPQSDPAPGATSLLDVIHLDKTSPNAAALEALLGSYMLVEDLDAALTAHEMSPEYCYVCKTAERVLPTGEVIIGKLQAASQGAFERKRELREISAQITELEQALASSEQSRIELESKQTQAQEDLAQNKRAVAELLGEKSAADAELARLTQQVTRLSSEEASITKTRDEAREKSKSARDEIETLEDELEGAQDFARELLEQLQDTQGAHEQAIKSSGKLSHELGDTRTKLAAAREREKSYTRRVEILRATLLELNQKLKLTDETARALEIVRHRVEPLHEQLSAMHDAAQAWARRLKDRASLAEADSDSLKQTISEAKEAQASAQAQLEKEKSTASGLQVDRGKLEVQVEQAIQAIVATGAILDDALTIAAPENREETERQVSSLKRQLKDIGPVNAVAMDEFTKLKERADHIGEQVQDLESARMSLRKITAAIERKMRARFLLVFEQVNQNFADVFKLLFPGGHAHLELTDPDHLSETGVEIIAQPRGKKISKMSLMSGGEKSLVALALLFAVYQTRTVPFYVFDEVEAALDDSNLSRLLDAIERLKESTQLIVISHQRRTMEQADVLYGVSMQADGVSHVISQRLDVQTGKVVDA